MRKGYAELIEQQKATRIVEGTNDTPREESSTLCINLLSMKGPKYLNSESCTMHLSALIHKHLF